MKSGRIGLLAEKLGMTQVFAADGSFVPVTLLQVQNCSVVGVRTQETDGYTAVQIGSHLAKASSLSKPMKCVFAKKQIEGVKHIHEFRVPGEATSGMEVGAKINADHFEAGKYIDASGITIGKGFQGGMKRWGFGGLRATHGVSVSHRSHGSTGNRQDPGKVFKNKKMAGHMGAKQITTLNLLVHSVDSERNLIYIKGCVPGPKGSVLALRDAIKKKA